MGKAMSFYTAEKKVAKHTKSEFELKIDMDDFNEFYRLLELKNEPDVRTVKAEIVLKPKDSSLGDDRIVNLSLRVK
jgi:hypothetical protein